MFASLWIPAFAGMTCPRTEFANSIRNVPPNAQINIGKGITQASLKEFLKFPAIFTAAAIDQYQLYQGFTGKS
jgi:hypothetical protein